MGVWNTHTIPLKGQHEININDPPPLWDTDKISNRNGTDRCSWKQTGFLLRILRSQKVQKTFFLYLLLLFYIYLTAPPQNYTYTFHAFQKYVSNKEHPQAGHKQGQENILHASANGGFFFLKKYKFHDGSEFWPCLQHLHRLQHHCILGIKDISSVSLCQGQEGNVF